MTGLGAQRTFSPLAWLQGVGTRLAGPLPASTRQTARIDLAHASLYGVLAATLTFIAVILRRLGATPEQVAAYYSLSYLGLVSAGVSMGLMRRFGMQRFAVTCWLISRSAFILAALATNATALLALTVVFWLLDGWTGPAYTQTIRSVYPDEQRGRIISTVRLGTATVALIFTPLAGWILDNLGYQVLLPMGGLAGVAAALVFARVMRRAGDGLAPPSPEKRSALRLLRANPRFTIYLCSMLLFGLAGLIPSSLYPIVQVDYLNLSYTEVGLLGLAQSLAWLTGYLVIGRLVDRLGGVRSLQLVFVVNAIVMLPYVWATQGWMLLPSYVASGLVTAGVDVAVISTVIQLSEPGRVTVYAAANSTLVGVRGLIAPFLGPILLSAGVPSAAIFALSAALTLVGAAVLIAAARSR